jgi:GntR family transcriptional regulator
MQARKTCVPRAPLGPDLTRDTPGDKCQDNFSGEGGPLQYRPGVPRYLQIAEDLRHELRGEGERIPSEHQLCARYKVSRPTIRQALDLLVQEGLLYRHAGRGTFSTPTPGGERKLRVIGSVGDMMALGDETWFKLVAREVVPMAPNIAQSLKLPPHSPGWRIIGVRHADQGPFQHVTAYLPPAIGEALNEEDLSKTSLIALIERQLGKPIKFMEQVTDAALAPRQVAELLQVRPRTPLLQFERTYFAGSGDPVEHTITYQTGRRYPYRVVLSRSERRS